VAAEATGAANARQSESRVSAGCQPAVNRDRRAL